jgi:hypothetical protein
MIDSAKPQRRSELLSVVRPARIGDGERADRHVQILQCPSLRDLGLTTEYPTTVTGMSTTTQTIPNECNAERMSRMSSNARTRVDVIVPGGMRREPE